MTDSEIVQIYEEGKGTSHLDGLRAVYRAGVAERPSIVLQEVVKPAKPKKRVKRKK